jgi:hypothetical protein
MSIEEIVVEDNGQPFTIEEISGILSKRYASVKKDVENFNKPAKPAPKSEKPDTDGKLPAWMDDDCSAEDHYYYEQGIANESKELKDYYNNPNKSTLRELKSKIGHGVDEIFSPAAVKLLKDKFQHDDKKKDRDYARLVLQERILATPDETWKKALEQTAETLGCIQHAPTSESHYGYGAPFLAYHASLEIGGDASKLVNFLITNEKKAVDNYTDYILNDNILGINEFFSPTITLGNSLREIKHLEEKGLENYVGIFERSSSSFKITKQDSNKYLLRFFVIQQETPFEHGGSDRESPLSGFHALQRLMLDNGLAVKQTKEELGQLQIMPSMNYLFTILDKHEDEVLKKLGANYTKNNKK